MKVYLAGPITGLKHEEATSWRDDVSDRLSADGIACISPLRGKDYLKGTGHIEAYGYNNPLSTDRAIVTRDRLDLTSSNLVIMNLLGTSRISIGTMVELGWADAHKIPVLLIIEDHETSMPPRNPHEHAFVRELTGWRVNSVEQAIHMVRSILLVNP
jgi:nucleoside 2-deoxyribosyltransferase